MDFGVCRPTRGILDQSWNWSISLIPGFKWCLCKFTAEPRSVVRFPIKLTGEFYNIIITITEPEFVSGDFTFNLHCTIVRFFQRSRILELNSQSHIWRWFLLLDDVFIGILNTRSVIQYVFFGCFADVGEFPTTMIGIIERWKKLSQSLLSCSMIFICLSSMTWHACPCNLFFNKINRCWCCFFGTSGSASLHALMNCCTESLEDEDAAMLNAVVLMMAANCSMAFLIALSSSCKVESMSSSIANWCSKGNSQLLRSSSRDSTLNSPS
ncbi:uncharacterized protein LOC128879191 isoform X2 [Hylaeus volcanicus]|uniref:uncharacterized protein LOC128879191 isoform X2 n=1 Tax=Hylaeus volcanicus TaxID=313075 RepID=UPI0023B7F8FD|nr:uncharacterized protein LOC128879191 isoform X2 [Hylaeus volcanicus]